MPNNLSLKMVPARVRHRSNVGGCVSLWWGFFKGLLYNAKQQQNVPFKRVCRHRKRLAHARRVQLVPSNSTAMPTDSARLTVLCAHNRGT